MALLERLRSRASGGLTPGQRESDRPGETATRLIDEGNVLEDAGRLDEALRRYEAALRMAPNLARAHLNRGNALLKKGDVPGAMSAYEAALINDPAYAAAHFNMGNACARSGRLDAARAAYCRAIELKPEFADAEIALAQVLQGTGKFDQAVEHYRRALDIRPDNALTHRILGTVLRDLGRRADAASSYRRALAIEPDDEATHCELGNVLKELGQFEDAVASYGCALRLNPKLAIAHCNLGSTLIELGQTMEAVESYRRALELEPAFAAAHYNLGNALVRLRQLDDAAKSYWRAIELQPTLTAAHCNLANLLRDLGRPKDAVAAYREALNLEPDAAMIHSNLGNALRDLGQQQAAEESYRRAVELDAAYAEGHYNLGTLLKGGGRLHEAIANLSRSIELNPDSAEAHNNLGSALQDLGQMREALTSYRRAIDIDPNFAVAHSNVLFCLSHSEETTPAQLFTEHCLFGKHFETPLRASWPKHKNSGDSQRPLRVGFISPDLRSHPVAYFIEPLLQHLATSTSLMLYAYHTHALEDHVTQRLRSRFKHWHSVHRLSDLQLAEKVREDAIDILIDLSGHTAEHRLLTFAKKPAPVQASWLGYPGTTGLRAMDYYISDSFLLPPGRFDDQFLEKLVRLPASAPFVSDETAPDVNALPALTNGYVTFGSFNRLSKLSGFVIALWSSLLRSIPSARLLLCGMPPDGRLDGLIDAFKQHGITRERLRFHARCDTAKYMELHHQIDLCLDTYPYTGGTTTNHALWMGVPTLTLAGPTPPGRQGAAVMGRVGLDGFVASDPADFQAKGLKWARDTAALAEIRAGLRQRCAESVTRRPDVIALALEGALRTMWQRWCRGEPPETFVADATL